jgi:glycosyltransferase involved in cell wall biosynthesis
MTQCLSRQAHEGVSQELNSIRCMLNIAASPGFTPAMPPTIAPKTCIFTIAAKNYLHFVRPLMDSVAAFAPDADRCLALCDEPDGSVAAGNAFRVLPLSELPIPDIDRFTFQYTLLEISTAIKPFVFEKLLTHDGYDQVIYFDPDIRIYRSLDEMMGLLESHPLLLTPHLTEPINDDKRPSERDIMRSGVHNLGYLGLRRTPATENLLKWWQQRLSRDCVVDFEHGLFVDQKWMDLAPSLCEGALVNRDPSWNVAYWNLHGRRVEKTGQGYTVNGIPLTFYHFSGFDPDREVFSKHQDRFTLASVAPAVREICADYAAQLRKHGYPGNQAAPYAHANFPDGTPIPTAARKLYRENRDVFASDWKRFQEWLNEPAAMEGRRAPLVSRLAYEVYQMPTHAYLKGQFPDVLGVHARGYAEWFVANAGELAGIPECFRAPMRAALAAREDESPTRPLDAFAKSFYQFAWRHKDLTHNFLPLETRQKIGSWLLNRAYAKAEAQPARTAPSSERAHAVPSTPIRVLYDIAVLGRGHHEEKARTGVFRVVENVALALAQDASLTLGFCASDCSARCQQYLESQKALSDVPLKSRPVPIVLDKVELALMNASSRAKAGWTVGRVVRGGLAFATRQAVERLQVVGEAELAGADIYHSPFYPLPTSTKNQPHLHRFLTVYDLIALLRPDLFESSVVRLMKQVLASLTPSDWVLCISEATRRDLLAYRPDLDPARVRITYLAAAEHFRPDPRQGEWPALKRKYNLPDEPYALTLSTLEPRKNIAQVIRCYARLVAEGRVGDMRLVMVGTRGWKMESIFKELDNLGSLGERVIVTGFVPEEDLAPIYSHALMFVYPSLLEGFGLPPLEAMQCGVPVITSNTSSLPEVVGDAGIMVSPTDADALCQAMTTLFQDRELRDRLASLARARAATFSWARCASETVAAYRSAMGS